MSIAFVRVNLAVQNNNNANLTPALHASTADGEALLAVVGASKGSTWTMNLPAGWTAEFDASSGASSTRAHLNVSYRSASSDASNAGYTWHASGATVGWNLAVLEYSGQNTTTPITAGTAGSAGSTTAPTITPDVNNCVILYCLALTAAASVTDDTNLTGAGWTKRVDQVTTGAAGTDVHLYTYELTQTAAAATGGIAPTAVSSATNAIAGLIVIRPALPAGTAAPPTVSSTSAVGGPTVTADTTVVPAVVASTSSVPAVTVTGTASISAIIVNQGWIAGSTAGLSVGSVTGTFPNTPAVGSTLVAVVNGNHTFTTPSGWSAYGNYVNTTAMYVFWKTAGVSEPTTVTATFTSGQTGVAGIAIAELASATTLFDPTSGTAVRGNASTPVSVSIGTVTAQADELIVAVMGSIGSAVNWAGWTGGFTEQVDVVTTGGTKVSLAVATNNLIGPSTYTTQAQTFNNTNTLTAVPAQALIFGLKAAAATTVRPAQVISTTAVGAPTVSGTVPTTVTPVVVASTSAVGAPTVVAAGQTVVPPATVRAVGHVGGIVAAITSDIVTPATVAARGSTPPPASIAGTPVTTVTPTVVASVGAVGVPTLVVTSAVNATVTPSTSVAFATVPVDVVFTGTTVAVNPLTVVSRSAVLKPSGAATGVAVQVQTVMGFTVVVAGSPSITVPTYRFTPPTVFDQPVTDLTSNIMNRLMAHYRPGERGQSVWVLTDGTYTLQQPVYWEQVDHVFYGGHQYTVSADEAAKLADAGFSVTQATG